MEKFNKQKAQKIISRHLYAHHQAQTAFNVLLIHLRSFIFFFKK